MAKFKINIKRVESYSMDVVVDAKDLDEAIEKVTEKWEKDYELYDELTKVQDDADMNFYKCGLATDDDINGLTNI